MLSFYREGLWWLVIFKMAASSQKYLPRRRSIVLQKYSKERQAKRSRSDDIRSMMSVQFETQNVASISKGRIDDILMSNTKIMAKNVLFLHLVFTFGST